MKCKYCGAEVNSESKICPFCNSEIVKEQPTVNVTNNYYGSSGSQNETNAVCPKCGSKNIKFRREEVGNTKSKTSKQVYYRTVAICQSCGTTWVPNASSPKNKHSIWWWLIVILFYPISLTVWFIKTPKLKIDKKYRIILVVAIWLVFILLGAFSQKTDPSIDESVTESSISQVSEAAANAEKEALFMIDNVELGEYGKKKTVNKDTESEYTFIEYHIPAGKYKVTNLHPKTITQLSVYSNKYVKNDSGWEEAAESFGIFVLTPEKSEIITIGKDQHIKCSDGETKLSFEKAE